MSTLKARATIKAFLDGRRAMPIYIAMKIKERLTPNQHKEDDMSNEFKPKNSEGKECTDCEWWKASQEAVRENMIIARTALDKLDKGRDYLMTIQPDELTVEDALEAFGFGRDGMQR